MCDPITLMMIASSASKLVMANEQKKAAKNEANIAETRAQQQAQQEYAASQNQLAAEYSETQRQISDANDEDLEGKSDAIRAANKSLGTLRATETALSDSSLGTILFEEAYGNAMNYTRIGNTTDRKIDTLESNKKSQKQSYINRTTLAANNLANASAEAEKRRRTASLNFKSQVLSIGADSATSYGNYQVATGNY